MPNPILQLLSGNRPQNSTENRIQAIKSYMRGKDSNALYNQMMKTNSQFRDFVKDVEGKSIEDVAMEYDIDLNILRKFL